MFRKKVIAKKVQKSPTLVLIILKYVNLGNFLRYQIHLGLRALF